MGKGNMKVEKTAIEKGLQRGFKKCIGAIKNTKK
jgi:hypothetical protein